MSEIKRISPLLDNYDIGGPISEHNGVVCYPAMRKDSDDKYIVKTVSIPASQSRLDALLLTGAFPDATAALSYFKELADSVVDELELLRRLSQVEGFIPYESWQVSTMCDSIGFEVCMLSPYKKSLRKNLQKQPMTHLAAINLGLDICTALSVCRRSGFLFANLKPNNIFLTDNQQFRIGDLGFVPMSSLSYASLPDRYLSEYTAPEVQDAFASLNSTIDIYALGLILYQIYNSGQLPGKSSESEENFPAPVNADYEMAEIILKACHPDPNCRWEDPVQMGQALVGYMQRNGANDTPILPPIIPVDLDSLMTNVDDIDLSDIDLSDVPDVEGLDIADITDAEVGNDIAEDMQPDAEIVSNAETEIDSTEDTLEQSEDLAAVEDVPEQPADAVLAFIDDVSLDETSPENNIDAVDYAEVTDELNEMLLQADELVAHPVPDPVVAPEPIEVKLPPVEETVEDAVDTDEAPQQSGDKETSETSTETSLEETVIISVPGQAEEEAVEAEPDSNEEESTIAAEAEYPKPEPEKKKKSTVIWVLNAILILLILAILAVGFFYYQNIYLLPINDVTVTGDETSMVVHLESDVDESILSVVCSDSHGNQISAPVVNGTATFANLAPDTAYNIQILVEGFHRLTGETGASYSTPPQVNIVQFNAVTGTEAGSVILRFTPDNDNATDWSLSYSADGEEEVVIKLDANLATLSGLTIGKEYTFTLIPADDTYVTGQTELKFTASEIVYAENVNVVSCLNNQLVVEWDAPEDVDVTEWTVRCYNDSDYNETTITADTTASFDNIDPAFKYTVDVTAAGMSVSKRAYMPANAITITEFKASTTASNQLVLEWVTDQGVPADGWVLRYSVGNSTTQTSVVCDDNTAIIAPVVPAATYHFTIQRANGDAVLTQPLTYTTGRAADFSGYGMTRSSMTYTLLETPEQADWSHDDVSSSDYTNVFKVGERISVVGQLHDIYGTHDDNIVTMFVFRDAENNVVSYCYSEAPWNTMWSKYYGEFDIQQVPAETGEYTLTIYFNGKLVTNKAVVIEE